MWCDPITSFIDTAGDVLISGGAYTVGLSLVGTVAFGAALVFAKLPLSGKVFSIAGLAASVIVGCWYVYASSLIC